jgi:hypothetical protein
MKTTSRKQVSTGLTVYPVHLADGRVVWVSVPTDETPAELVACDCCGGTGRVDGPTRDGYGVREDYPAEVECPHCGGTGVQEV